MPLTPKQHRFVTEYLVDLNASQAALRAGYSPRTAPQQGSRNKATRAVVVFTPKTDHYAFVGTWTLGKLVSGLVTFHNVWRPQGDTESGLRPTAIRGGDQSGGHGP